MTKLKIVKAREGGFTSSDGKRINYFWYKALREEDGVTIEFGSKKEYEEGEEIEIYLEKNEMPGGKFRYKESNLD